MHGKFIATLTAIALTGCAMAQPAGNLQPPAQTMGPNPVLPLPTRQIIPTVHIAPAKGWPEGVQPTPAAGLSVAPMATGLDHPRWVYVLPNGDVLVAESNAPPKPSDGKGIKGAVMGLVMKRAGAGVPSANRITLLRDVDGNGKADLRTTFLQNLNSPIGMALVGNTFYVANSDGIVSFPYTPGQTQITAAPTPVADLPAGPINHHWTKNIIASADGSKLYATVGSNSNVGENGIAAEQGRAAIWEVSIPSGTSRIYASGLRNPNGMAWGPGNALWTVANERDELGDDLVPDYLTSVTEGAFYGWPYSYFGQNVDVRVKPQRPDLVAKAVSPDYALGAHVAPLGLTSSDGAALPAPFAGGFFIGEHGSWNRKPRSGYAVVFVPFGAGGTKPTAQPIPVLTGFVSPDGDAWGRPVGVAIDKRGALLVADDVGNVIWRVTSTTPVAVQAPSARPAASGAR
ncbi:MAG: sorbosone dehydrogenase family protein [Bdellovibrionales bacterium]|nr:sorbosone dehydrogenase family protein [Ramlibacter sp.]